MRRAVRVIVSGRVQGVGFRDWTQREGSALGLTGWVRNVRADGTVEAVLAGDDAAVDTMLTALRKGPTASRVKQVAVEEWTGVVPGTFEFRETV